MKELLEQLGVDEKNLMARFMNNEALVWRFLKKFPQDKTYEALCKAVEEKDYPTIEAAAHTLKGVSANLELKDFCACNTQIVEAVRKKNYDVIPDIFSDEQEEYRRIVDCIEKYDTK